MPRSFKLATLALGAFAACQPHAAPTHSGSHPLPRVAVEVARARFTPRALGEEVVGTVRAKTVSAVSTSVMGTVRELRVGIGSHVRAGDLIARLSAGEIDAKAEQARARFSQAELNLRRVEGLKARDAVSQSGFDTAEAEHRVAQAALSEAEVMTGYMLIRAPLSGVVTEKNVDVGDLALPGKALVVIEDPAVLRLDAALPESSASGVRVGQHLPVRIDALDRVFTGTVSEISPNADPASRTLAIKLDLPKEAGLRPGMFGRLLLSSDDGSVLTVPSAALARHGQLETVFVVENGTANLRLVRSGRSEQDAVEILAGLSEHESVVLGHNAALRDGQQVEIAP